MGYQALLFCPDEKTARTVTQVLSELDFEVVPCTEPFAAVKQMMAAHFDAIVVDCDNEQNATLLFKSARNAPNNQSALAVAVVEGQAGVAKAFRIGANLVLTKPINVEQAKGTLRVARGLLRKNETAKAAGVAAPGAAKIAVPEATAKSTTIAPAIQETKPAPIAAPQPTAHEKIASKIEPQIQAPSSSSMIEPKKIDSKKTEPKKIDSKPTEKPSFAVHAAAPAVELGESKKSVSAKADSGTDSVRPLSARASSLASPSLTSTGAASAPAPAREVKTNVAAPEKPSDVVAEPEATAVTTSDVTTSAGDAPASAEETYSSSVPAFAMGKTRAASPGSKKMLMAVAAVVVIAAAGYFAWMQFGPAARPSAVSATPSSRTTPAVPVANPPAATTTAPTLSPAPTAVAAPSPAATEQPSTSAKTSTTTAEAPKADSAKTHVGKPNTPANATDAPPSVAKAKASAASAAPAIKIKSSTEHASVSADDAAPPAITAMPSANSEAMPSLLDNAGSSVAPRLQTLNVSQGISRGLLVKQVQPTYPPDAMRLNVEGQVKLMATLSKTGDISAVKILSGDLRLAHAAVAAVKQWKYKPYLLNGEPVEIQTQVTVNFKLPH